MKLEELQGHMRECILEERLVELLLEFEYEAYLYNMVVVEMEGERVELKPHVEEMFAHADEQDIRGLASDMLCDEFIIELLLERSDGDFRWDIMHSSKEWNPDLNWKLIAGKGIWMN